MFAVARLTPRPPARVLSKNRNNLESGALKAWLKEHGFREIDTVFIQLAQGNLGLSKVCRELVPDSPEEVNEDVAVNALGKIMDRIRGRGSRSPVLVSGTEDVLVAFAKCCNPLPKEPVAGYVTRGRGSPRPLWCWNSR